MTGAPMPDGRRRRRDGRADRARSTAAGHGARSTWRSSPAPTVRAAGDDLQRRRAWCSPPGDELDPGPPRRAGVRSGVAEVARPPPAPGRRALDRRRAGRRPGAAAARADPRLQPARRCSPWSPRPASTPSTSGCVRDDEAAITAAHRAGRRPPATRSCSSGGVSMGDFDFVKVVLDRIGDMRWMQVAIRPAKPLAFGVVPRRRRRRRCRCSACPATRCRRW